MTNQPLYIKLNNSRKAEYSLRTEIWRKGEEFWVSKTAESKEGKIFLKQIYETYKKLSLLNLPFIVNNAFLNDKGLLQMEYIEGKSLLSELEDTIKSNGVNEFTNTLKFFEQNILNKLPSKESFLDKDFYNIFGKDNGKTKYEIIKPGVLDLNLDNLIKDKKGKIHLIDYEWTFDFGIPKRYILYRTIFNSFLYLKNHLDGKIDIKTIEKQFDYNKEEVSKYLEWESNFQDHVLKIDSSKINLYKNKKKLLSYNLKSDTVLTDKEEILREKQIEKESFNSQIESLENNLNFLLKEKEDLQRKLEEVEPIAAEFNIFKQTAIWKTLIKYRNLKKYFRRKN